MERKTNYKAPALEKGLDILELLAKSERPLNNQEISQALDRNLNEIFRMIVILQQRQYIQQQATGYTLSPKMFRLSNQYPPLARIIDYAPPVLKKLCQDTLQSCHIAVLNDGSMVVVAQQDSVYKMGFSVRLGAEIDLCGSGSGYVALAYLPPEQAERELKYSGATEQEKQYAVSFKHQILAQGYYLGESPQVPGITNISYPIFTVNNRFFASITIPYLEMDLNTLHHHIQHIDTTRQELSNVAQQFSYYLGAL